MKSLKTAPQILEHYTTWYYYWRQIKEILKAMRCYAKYKSDVAYEKWFQTALKMLEERI